MSALRRRRRQAAADLRLLLAGCSGVQIITTTCVIIALRPVGSAAGEPVGSVSIITGLTMARFLLAVSAGAKNRVLRRTRVWVGRVLGALGLITPHSAGLTPVSYNPLPYLNSLLWIAAVSVLRMVGRPASAASSRPGRVLSWVGA